MEDYLMKKTIAISSGHGLHVRDASGHVDEVDEARKVVDRVAEDLRALGHVALVFHDDASGTQARNLDATVGWHNKQARDLDLSVHFNSSPDGLVEKAIGVEAAVHPSADGATRGIASRLAKAVADSGGLRLRRPGKWPGVHEVNTSFGRVCKKNPVILEVCFVNSAEDCRLYGERFEAICAAIARELAA